MIYGQCVCGTNWWWTGNYKDGCPPCSRCGRDINRKDFERARSSRKKGLVAQRLEQQTHNLLVGGSSPPEPIGD